MSCVVKMNAMRLGNCFRCRSKPKAILRQCLRYTASFRFADLEVTVADDSQKRPKPESRAMRFGQLLSDHMLEIDWQRQRGWGPPRIVPLHDLALHPSAKVLHYGQGLFEGLKAFWTGQGAVLFRPEMNMNRMLASAQRAGLPAFDPDELLGCLKKLISVDRDWIPRDDLCSLYIRPTFIGTGNTLGVHAADSALLYVVTSPVGCYFESKMSPLALMADPKFVRAWPGGVGDKKMGCNYSPTLYVQDTAEQKGLHQVLWLIGDDHQVAENSASNVFFLLAKGDQKLELATPPLDGTILPGVVRQSVLDLTRDWNEFEVSERPISMKEIVRASAEGTLLEAFVSGTALIVCPIQSIDYVGQRISIPVEDAKYKLYERLLTQITDIQYGRVKSKWTVPVD